MNMGDIKVVDNFLEKDTFKYIQGEVLSRRFNWTWCDSVLGYTEDHVNPADDTQFEHLMMATQPVAMKIGQKYEFYISPTMELIRPILNNVPIRSLFRVKFNLNPRTPNIIEHGFHVDCAYPDSVTAVMYFNTCNGYTKFEDGTKVESVENRMVFFNSQMKHTGSTCTDEKRRVVLNLNYF